MSLWVSEEAVRKFAEESAYRLRKVGNGYAVDDEATGEECFGPMASLEDCWRWLNALVPDVPKDTH